MTTPLQTNLDFNFPQSRQAADCATRFLLSRGYVVFNVFIILVNSIVLTGQLGYGFQNYESWAVNFIFALELFVNIDMLFDLILRLIGKRKVFWLSWYTVADFSVTIVSWITLILTWLETAVIVEFSFNATVTIIAMRVISSLLRIAVIIKNQVLSVRANKHKIEVDAIGPDFLASHGLNEVSHEQIQLDLDKLTSSTSETISQPTSARSARNSFDIAMQKFHNSVELSDLRHARMKEALLESSETFEDEFVMRMTGEV